ncbi:hypothetical protein AJ80_03169 [Polytolypa hystricis UAMH7299]|uniref:mRNA export factor GLE1 n=1 Tax=Polytolypa hystricis (strain UAMH7299) TaxID=1447883 RepID=A0A2B7YKB6_POLH7|nr:hypothetical protein AJ80_03169 [Polytolypa hystricis UAMH7299]
MGRPTVYSPRLQDSPSRQLIHDLAKDLEQVRLHNTELKRVRAYERRSFYENLDRLDREREEVHNAALAAAAAKRDALRQEAEETLQQHLREVEAERLRQEELERRRRERLERAKVEKEQREREEAARLEAERRAQEEEKRRKAEEAERARKAQEEEKARQERERAAQEEKKQKEDAERKRLEQEAAEKNALEEKKKAEPPSVAPRRTPEEIAEHKRYIELHKHLKQFRKYMMDETKKNPVLKQHMGDMRRTIKKCVGQLLSEGKTANRAPTTEINNILKKAATLQEPSVDVRQFIAFPPAQLSSATDAKVPALLIYLLNIFSKAIIAQLIAEAGINPKYAEPLGVLTAQIFSLEAFTYNGVSMIDILLAKYHVVCPVLWGFYGDENTERGRAAVGWWREEQPSGPFVGAQTHEERMTGLGAGWAAISLRNFSKTTRKNPVPNTHFWKAVTNIVNVPANEVQDTHLFVLSAMLRFSTARIVGFWADSGMALLRRAIVGFPAELQRKSPARSALEVLRDVLAKEHNILL